MEWVRNHIRWHALRHQENETSCNTCQAFSSYLQLAEGLKDRIFIVYQDWIKFDVILYMVNIFNFIDDDRQKKMAANITANFIDNSQKERQKSDAL